MDDFDFSSLYSLEAEQFAIGGILLDPERFDEAAAVVGKSDFFARQNRMIFEAMTTVMSRGQFPEYALVCDHLMHVDGQENWISKLAAIQKNTPSSRNVVAYAAKVREYAKVRALFQAGGKISDIAKDGARTLQERIAAANDELAALSDSQTGAGPRWIGKALPSFIEHLDKCRLAEGGITGLRTGYENVDKRIGGLQPGGLYIIAARPAMGKSVMGLNIARSVVLGEGRAALYFSLEMPETELLGRLTADYGNIPYNLVRTAQFETDENDYWPRLNKVVGHAKECDLAVDETPMLSINDIVARAKLMQRIKPLSLIVVDHLHLVEAEGENEVIKIGKVSSGLKRLAKELSVPVLALCQLNRGCDARPNKRPLMSDLRQSGNIEQDADWIGFIYRDVVYNENTDHPDLAELIWRKARGGETGTDYFKSELGFCRFAAVEAPAQAVEVVQISGRRRKQL
jgi:replicative DNA helicase